MKHDDNQFAQLVQAARNGCPDAARVLLSEHGPTILRVVRRHLHQRLRGRFDSEDFRQAVWASFFALPPDRVTFRTPQELAGFLAALANNKVAEEFRRQIQTAKHGQGREKSLEAVGEQIPVWERAVVDTPSQTAVADECWDRLTRNLTDDKRRVLELLRDGCTYQEISQATGLHPKAIQRYLRKLNEGLRQ